MSILLENHGKLINLCSKMNNKSSHEPQTRTSLIAWPHQSENEIFQFLIDYGNLNDEVNLY